MTARGGGFVVASALMATLWLAMPAAADRKPTATEEAAIERVALAACAAPQGDCAFQGARVSTRDERFGWARIVGEGISGALVKRPSSDAGSFRVVGIQGGGIGECSYWRKRAPRKVLRDLRVRGLVKSGDVRNCGKRR
jgi:hypothetical protein